MTESVFSIFPDRHLTSGQNLKGKVPRSKKNALCDVKNTLLSKPVPMNEPLRKAVLDPLSNPVSSCKQFLREPVKETPAKSKLRQEGTFSIATDDTENDAYWASCGKHELLEDSIFDIRPPSSHLRDADIKYLARGMFCPEKIESSSLLDDNLIFEQSITEKMALLEDERVFPPLSPLTLQPTSPIELSDDE